MGNWSVFKMTPNGWRTIFRAKSFQHACRVYDDLRAKMPNEVLTINYGYSAQEV